ncbi:MAG: acetyl-CoA carboxylase biotin carboxyl carrier protein [candidate division Zixibacteria bacterium]|nr:acetyl-CoA carboxylase biotin carboxyl carrier protein [candidate division Zixibacteria bacterium]
MLESRIKKIIKLLEESDSVNEIEISSWWRKLRVSKNSANNSNGHSQNGPKTERIMTPVPDTAPAQPLAVPAPSAQAEASPERKNSWVSIKSPMVGTFYRAPSPDAEPYVTEGQEVKPGQVVCIIEAMKLMNEIESELSGKVVKVCVPNAKAVEFGQEMFVIEPIS